MQSPERNRRLVLAHPEETSYPDAASLAESHVSSATFTKRRSGGTKNEFTKLNELCAGTDGVDPLYFGHHGIERPLWRPIRVSLAPIFHDWCAAVL